MGSVLRLAGSFFIFSIFLMSCSTSSKSSAYQVGLASWYGKQFHGKVTANGETYNMNALTAAHPSLAFGTQVLVRNVANGASVIVRINDRGPYAKRRIIDLSYAAAKKLGMISDGEIEVELFLVTE